MPPNDRDNAAQQSQEFEQQRIREEDQRRASGGSSFHVRDEQPSLPHPLSPKKFSLWRRLSRRFWAAIGFSDNEADTLPRHKQFDSSDEYFPPPDPMKYKDRQAFGSWDSDPGKGDREDRHNYGK